MRLIRAILVTDFKFLSKLLSIIYCSRKPLLPPGPYEVDCKGVKGNYVFVQLPGDNRQLGLEEVEVFGYSS